MELATIFNRYLKSPLFIATFIISTEVIFVRAHPPIRCVSFDLFSNKCRDVLLALSRHRTGDGFLWEAFSFLPRGYRNLFINNFL